MEKTTKELLDEAIETEIDNLYQISLKPDEKSKVVDDLVKLYKLKIEETKVESEIEEKNRIRISEDMNRTYEMKLKDNQLSEQVKDRYFRLGIAAAELILPLIFYGIWMRKGLKFEETGAFTSTTFKGLLNKFKPTKK